MNLKTIIIAGPTASGKTDIAHLISKKYPSTIINADSMQVYKDFSILTNRPREKDLINYNLLSNDEKIYLKNYHKLVYKKIRLFLNIEEKKWLKSLI